MVTLALACACSTSDPSAKIDASDGSHSELDGSAGDAVVEDADASHTDGGPTCSLELWNLPSHTLFGFGGEPEVCWGPEAAVITVVDPNKLELVRQGDTQTVVFYWLGPDLTTRFQVGESVQISARSANAWSATPPGCERDWSVVVGASSVAATWDGFGDFGASAPPIPKLPNDGPVITRTPFCTAAANDCDGPSVFDALRVGEADAPVLAEPGKTVEVEGWLVTNVNVSFHPNSECNNYEPEDMEIVRATALGPASSN